MPPGRQTEAYRTSFDLRKESTGPSSRSAPNRDATVTCSCGRMKALLSIGEAAERLGLHRTTLYRMIENGQLPVDCFRVGNTTKLSWAQVEEWLRTGPAQTSTQAAPTSTRRSTGPSAGLQAPRRIRGASANLNRYSSAPSA